MPAPLTSLGVTSPVLAAPMAGGPTTPALVAAAAEAGGLGFLAGGYLDAGSLAGQVAAVRALTGTFGVNLFAPNPVPVDPGEYRRYAAAVRPVAERLGATLPGDGPVEDDDRWDAKLDLLLSDPVPVVSFTFGIPEASAIAALRRAGSLTVQTVTSVDEALLAEAAGVDVLAVQGSGAGGHSGTLDPRRLPPRVPLPALVAAVRSATRRPLVAAGGVATPDHVAAALGAGAAAVMVGTALLLSDESGASPAYRDALADPSRGPTVVTRAFTGRPARGLPNAFTRELGSVAPLGYPAVHHLTRGLRRAAAAAGDPEYVNLWAGTGHRSAAGGPAAAILAHLAGKA